GIQNGKIYNGADDNASGVAALFYLAEYFIKNKPNHTLIFAAFDAEEAGFKGSSYFIEDYLKESNNIILNVNMDMIGISPKNEIYISGTYHHPFFKEYIPKSKRHAKIRLGHDNINTDMDDWTNQSDHYPFFEQGIPFLYFGVENHKHYHQPTDTYENINKKFYNSTVEIILETLKNLDEGLMLRASFRKNLKS
ncbi:M20/M25/M40 family metallo-hydrolase, partial [Pseudoxanthomonas sp. SGD-10]